MDSFRVSRGGRRETGSQVFERGARLRGFNQQVRQRAFLGAGDGAIECLGSELENHRRM
jgi:hypothetical protein